MFKSGQGSTIMLVKCERPITKDSGVPHLALQWRAASASRGLTPAPHHPCMFLCATHHQELAHDLPACVHIY